jgi:hypothetical protein
MMGTGGFVGCGQFAWRARLTCHFDILRLISRGLDRIRRFGFSRWQMGTSACAQLRSLPGESLPGGGKTARL